MVSPLQTTLSFSSETPSFFELYLIDRMDRSIAPAISHTFSTFAAHSSSMLWLTIAQYLDECTFLLKAALQAQSLWTSDSTVAEQLYQIKRETDDGGLSNRDRLRTLLFEVFITNS